MNSWLQRLGSLLARVAAGTLIVLALLVGAARLLLPEAPRFADDVRRIASAATGFEVDFALLSAGVSLHGPELRLREVTVQDSDGEPVAAARRIAIALSIPDLISRGRVQPSKVLADGVSLAIAVRADGEVWLQGRPLREFRLAESSSESAPELTIELRDIAIQYSDAVRAIQPVAAVVTDFSARLSQDSIEFDTEIEPEAALGRRLELDGTLPLALLQDPQGYAGADTWRLRMRASDFRLDPWLKLTAVKDAPIIGSSGTAEAALSFTGRQITEVLAELDIEDVAVAQAAAKPITYDAIAGKLSWVGTAAGWQASGTGLRIVRDGRAWPQDDFVVSYEELGAEQRQLTAQIEFVRAEDLTPLLRAFAGELLREAGLTGMPAGDIWNLRGSAVLIPEAPARFSLEADFQGLGYADAAAGILAQGFSGAVAASEDGGRLDLATQDARLGLDGLFREVFELTRLEGLAVWRANPAGYRLLANDIQIATPDGSGTASLELQTDADFGAPEIDLTAQASMDDTNQAVKYLPRKIPDPVVDWLRGALLGGRATNAEFRLRGPLGKFPFRNDEGEFRIAVEFAEGALNYGDGWPELSAATGELVFLNESLFSERNQFRLGELEVRDAQVRIDDLKDAVLRAQGDGSFGLADVVSFLQQSPLAEGLGPAFADVRASGTADAAVELVLPIRDLDAWTLQGEAAIRGGSAWLTSLEPRFTELSGSVKLNKLWVRSPELTGRLLGEPVKLSVAVDDAPTATWSHRVEVRGAMPYTKAESALGLPQLGKLSGDTDFTATAFFPAFGAASEPFRIELTSPLVGLASALPYPLNKPAERAEQLSAVLRFPAENRLAVDLTLQRGLLARLELGREDGAWALLPSAVGLNMPPPVFAGTRGLVVGGVVDRIDLNEWSAAFAADSATPDAGAADPAPRAWQSYFERIDLDIGELYAVGYRFPDVELGAAFGADAWQIDLDGPLAVGSMTVPYQFTADRNIELQLRRLDLVETAAASSGDDEDALSPLELPGIRGAIDSFTLGQLRLGAVETELLRTASGLEIGLLTARAPSFSLQASGDWLVIDSAQRSRLRLELSSNDMEQTLLQLGYSPLIDAESGLLVADLLWEGGPGFAALYASTGQVDFTIRQGEVRDIDPGSGRILGLLSLTSLPRRLSLDFSDMTEDGLVFDSIRGRFRMDFGDAWTCNLSLEGEVADMAIVGRTGLAAEDYDQVAVVRPHVSNLIPVSAAFLGGPTVGVASLLVAQIFKKPLSGIGESYYTVAGDWNAPDIRKAQRSELDTTAFADCESQLPVLSPEERAAIEDLIVGAAGSATEAAPPTTTEDTPPGP